MRGRPRKAESRTEKKKKRETAGTEMNRKKKIAKKVEGAFLPLSQEDGFSDFPRCLLNEGGLTPDAGLSERERERDVESPWRKKEERRWREGL